MTIIVQGGVLWMKLFEDESFLRENIPNQWYKGEPQIIPTLSILQNLTFLFQLKENENILKGIRRFKNESGTASLNHLRDGRRFPKQRKVL